MAVRLWIAAVALAFAGSVSMIHFVADVDLASRTVVAIVLATVTVVG